LGTDPDAYREQSRATWGEVAAGWEDRGRWMNEAARPVSDWILAQARLSPGDDVLEIAAGPGDLGLRAAAAVGGAGRVLSTDFAAAMVAAARRLGARRGLANVEYRVLDAERMDLGDSSVDAVVCRWAYMLMANPGAALRETRRVLRAGGSLAFAVWAEPERNAWAALPAATLVERGHLAAPEPGEPGMFALADGDRIEALVTGAGFDPPVLAEVPFEFVYASPDALWDTQTKMSFRLARAIADLPEAERAATRAAIEDRLAGFREADGSYRIPALCLGVSAR